jgi:site-specific recombinase XerD
MKGSITSFAADWLCWNADLAVRVTAFTNRMRLMVTANVDGARGLHLPNSAPFTWGNTMQFGVAIDGFLRFCAVERRLSEHSLQAYACDLADFRKWLPSETLPSSITQTILLSYLSDLVTERKLATTTVRRRFACLRGFFRWLIERGEAADPFTGWKLKLPRRKRLPRALSRPEVTSLLASTEDRKTDGRAAADRALWTAIRLMVATGIRVGELCKIRIEDVAPDGSALKILGKGSRDRVAYISDTGLRHELRIMIRDRGGEQDTTDSLFVNRHRAPMRPQSIRSRLRSYARRVGLPRRVTPHMLRHTAATLLIETGVDIRFVQRLLGHSSIATTEIYTHVSDEALRTTLQRADVLGMLGQR